MEFGKKLLEKQKKQEEQEKQKLLAPKTKEMTTGNSNTSRTVCCDPTGVDTDTCCLFSKVCLFSNFPDNSQGACNDCCGDCHCHGCDLNCI